jgi:hypothetical protein
LPTPISLFLAGPAHNQKHLSVPGKPVLEIFLFADVIETVVPLAWPWPLRGLALDLEGEIGHPARLAVTDFRNGGGIPPVTHLLEAPLDQVDALLTEERLLAEGFQVFSSQCGQGNHEKSTSDDVDNNTKTV